MFVYIRRTLIHFQIFVLLISTNLSMTQRSFRLLFSSVNHSLFKWEKIQDFFKRTFLVPRCHIIHHSTMRKTLLKIDVLRWLMLSTNCERERHQCRCGSSQCITCQFIIIFVSVRSNRRVKLNKCLHFSLSHIHTSEISKYHTHTTFCTASPILCTT